MKTNKNAAQYFDLIKKICVDEQFVKESDSQNMTLQSDLSKDLGLDSLDIATILVKLSDIFHVEFDIILPLQKPTTVGDICNLVNEKFYKHNAIKNHVFNELIADLFANSVNNGLNQSQIKYDTQISDIIKSNQCGWYFQPEFLCNTVNNKFNVYITYNPLTTKTLGDLCDAIAKEIIDVQKMRADIKSKHPTQPKKPANAYDNAREQTVVEMAEGLAKTNMVQTSKSENVTTKSDIHFNNVYDRAELSLLVSKKYGVNVNDKISHVKNVGDLCDVVIKTRLKKFQQLKYNSKQK